MDNKLINQDQMREKLREYVLINQDQMREKLREYVAIAGTQTIAAFQLGFSAGYLSDALAGRRDISRQLAERLGYERVLLFRVAGGETK